MKSLKFQCPHCEYKGRDGQRINLHILRMHEHHAKIHQFSLGDKTFAFVLNSMQKNMKKELI